MTENTEDVLAMLIAKVDEKINFGENLAEKLKDLESVDGVPKLKRKIRQEINFLKKLKNCKKVKEEHLSCSNLQHLNAVVNCALRPGVVAVYKTFQHTKGGKIVIDIISSSGNTWTKVVARNPRSLSALSQGNASYGARSVIDHAEDYLDCAKLHPCMYQPPQVLFEFTQGIDETLAERLQDLGVMVRGERIELSHERWTDSDEDSGVDEKPTEQATESNRSHQSPHIEKLNLDVTAMMAYISNMTNGHCHMEFKQSAMTQQGAWEASRPIKPVLDKLFEGKELICCDTAWDDFEKIVSTVGGEKEKERAKELRLRITVMADNSGGEDDVARVALKVGGQVRLRSKVVFNFGHRMRALTVSANEGFVRAAEQQGLNYETFIHEPRALTECKEAAAKPL